MYDQVSTTEEVYNDTAAPIVKAAMLGFHGKHGFMQDQIIASHTCFGGHMDVNC